MLIVTDLNSNTEGLTDYQGLEINEEVNGDFSISFTAFATNLNKHSFPLLEEESLIEYNGQEFRVKQLAETLNRKSVTSPHTFFDLIDVPKYEIFGGTKTPFEMFTWLLNGTSFTFEIVDDIPAAFFPNFGESNVLALIWKACEIFGCEIKIEPDKHIKVYKEIGEDNDFQFRYGYNIKTLNRNVDTTNLRTVIKGYGANGLEVTYTSPNVAIFGERHAEPIRDDRITSAETMLERLQRELNDTPEVSIEIFELDLGETKNLGDKVWLVYEPLKLEFQTRIMGRKTYPQYPSKNTVTLGTRKKKMSDLLTETKIEIDENAKENRSKIEQTNERISFEVQRIDGDVTEAYAQIEITADEIRQEVGATTDILDGRIEYNTSLINQTATDIRLEVTNEVERIDGDISDVNSSVAAIDLKADDISFTVTSMDNRLGSAESQLSVQAGQISSKVEKDGIISAFNQSPEAITLDASKINLTGITEVANTLFVGGDWQDSSEKFIYFRGYGGAVGIGSPANSDSLQLWALNDISFDTQYVFFYGTNVEFSGANVDFSGANVMNLNVNYASNAGNADTLDGYHASAFSISGHVHSNSEYVKPSSGQSIQLGVLTSQKRLNLYLNGSQVGYIPYT